MRGLRVGSLFAGIGGFDLGFHRAGFDVAWAAEWDKNAQKVLRRRFPGTTVYGDIREIDLDRVEPVDVICGGFPCQDLSVAGKRAGLAGERSGLFHDAMRIVRRLRPSVLVLENVPGLLSSNRGLDFATVLREVGEGWDCAEVAWRVLDSQFFGVAQRRRRVFIVAVRDPRLGCAEEILALAESGGGNPPAKREAREGSASDAARCPDGGRVVPALTSKMAKGTGGPNGDECQNLVAQPFSPHGHYRYEASEHAATLQSRENRQGGHTHLVAQAFCKSKRAQSATDDETWVDDGLANTLNGFDTGDARTTHAVAFTQNQRDEVRELGDRAASLSGQGTHQTNYVAFTIDMQACKGNASVGDGSVSPTLCKPSGNDCHAVALGVDVYNGVETGDVAATVTSATGIANASGPKAFAFAQNQVGEIRMGETMSTIGTTGNASARTTPKIMSGMVVRRLTPVECERLQGFPDGWTDIGTPEKPTADSHRYKQLGNAVTVNVAEWLASRIATVLKSQQ